MGSIHQLLHSTTEGAYSPHHPYTMPSRVYMWMWGMEYVHHVVGRSTPAVVWCAGVYGPVHLVSRGGDTHYHHLRRTPHTVSMCLVPVTPLLPGIHTPYISTSRGCSALELWYTRRMGVLVGMLVDGMVWDTSQGVDGTALRPPGWGPRGQVLGICTDIASGVLKEYQLQARNT